MADVDRFRTIFGLADEPDREFPATTVEIGQRIKSRTADESTMRSPGSGTLATRTFLAAIGLIVGPLTLGNSAMAANIHPKPALQGRAGDCRPQHLDTGQVIGAVLSQPWFVGRPPPMYINGCRIRVDPHGHYVPSEYQYNPATGTSELQ
jgi:hypothetical protein